MIGKPWSSLGVCDEALNAFARAFGCERHQLADPSCMNCHANGIKGFVAWQTTPHPVPGQTVLPLKPLPDADDAESWAKLAKELEGRAEATAKAIKALAEAQKVTPELMNQIVYALDTQRNVESYLLDRVATSPVPGQTREVTEGMADRARLEALADWCDKHGGIKVTLWADEGWDADDLFESPDDDDDLPMRFESLTALLDEIVKRHNAANNPLSAPHAGECSWGPCQHPTHHFDSGNTDGRCNCGVMEPNRWSTFTESAAQALDKVAADHRAAMNFTQASEYTDLASDLRRGQHLSAPHAGQTEVGND